MIKAEIKETIIGKNGSITLTEKVAVIKENDKSILTINLERNPEAISLIHELSKLGALEMEVIDPVSSKSMVQQNRELAGLTPEELGNMVGCSRQSIIKIENKVSVPKLNLAIKIADALHMDVRDILN